MISFIKNHVKADRTLSKPNHIVFYVVTQSCYAKKREQLCLPKGQHIRARTIDEVSHAASWSIMHRDSAGYKS